MSDTTWIVRDRTSGTYFQKWCPIGPLMTADPTKAARFATKAEADQINFSLCVFESVEVAADAATKGA